MDESLLRAVVLPLPSSIKAAIGLQSTGSRFFEVIAEIICSGEKHGFTFAQVVCLGLSNLCHPDLDTRQRAFDILEAIHEQSQGMLAMSHFEATVGSTASSTYVHAHRLVSEFLAGEHLGHAGSILAQLSSWLPRLADNPAFSPVVLLLQSLEFWIPNIQLMTEDKNTLSQQGYCALYHLIALTRAFSQSHTE
jgi:hypothetical protein